MSNAGSPLAPSTQNAPARLTEARLRKMPASAYMNHEQLIFFQLRLEEMRREALLRQVGSTQRLGHNERHADPADRATTEEENFLDMHLRERELRLLTKIEEALGRIRSKEYGYCDQTGSPIGIARLLTRPTTSVCVEVKDRSERLQKLNVPTPESE